MTRKKTSKKTSDDSLAIVLYCVIAVILSVIALVHTYTGFLGTLLYSIAFYLFGMYWILLYLFVIVAAVIKAFDLQTKVRYWAFCILVFIAVLLITNTLTIDKNLKPMTVFAEYLKNFSAVNAGKVSYSKAGFIGMLLYCLIASIANWVGVVIVAITLLMIAIVLIWPLVKPSIDKIRKQLEEENKATNHNKPIKNKSIEKKTKKPSIFMDVNKKVESEVKENNSNLDDQKVEKVVIEQEEKNQVQDLELIKEKKVIEEEFSDYSTEYNLPRLQYLDAVGANKKNVNAQFASEKWEILSNILDQFDLPSSLAKYNIGPSVTQFEIVPDGSFNIRKYLTVKENIKMSLAVKDIRIQCPIPGKSAVGIEIPNVKPSMVRLRELLSDVPDRYQHEPLMMALGKDIAGNNVYGLINNMPHLLIAGATGSGKSVCINSIILTLLLRARPDECKLLLIDPKKVEFTPYENVPHLICPIVNDTDKAAVALKKLLTIMEERYDKYSKCGVRNITDYNKTFPDKKMYNIVCIIDELADLMATHGKEVEGIIGRLASMARACGIYMILATQRPSTDVITGTIKANIVSRIAFAVNSSYDSRTILDQLGAEDLLGNGDMLYNPRGASTPIRVQGVYVSDDEIKNVINYFIKSNYKPHFADIFVIDEDGEESSLMTNGSQQINDPMYKEIEKWVVTQKTISATALQRRFGLGFPRAAKIIDMLQQNGVISGSNGSKPREVLKQLESEEQ